ncbi:MAG: isoprenylcysteine carboxylmethyltransferase family protein [Nitrospirota bacterium]
MSDFIALMTIMLWPAIPLFWIPVHGLSKIFRKLGLITYIIPLFTWLPLAYLIFQKRDFILQFRVEFPVVLNIIGVLLLAYGTLLHIWTGKLLGLWGLIGLPELSTKIKGRLVMEGPFSVVRHPTYLAHTLMFLGVFLLTEVTYVGVVTFLDLLIINILVIPLEEKELLSRFGDEYKIYRKKVPSRFFPWIRLQRS